jgi:hypothetical protein
VSLGRAADLCDTPVDDFMEFAGKREGPCNTGRRSLKKTVKRSNASNGEGGF